MHSWTCWCQCSLGANGWPGKFGSGSATEQSATLIIEFRQLEEWVIGPKWLLPEATVYVTDCFEKNIWYQHQQEEFGEFLMDLIIKENEIEILLYSRYSFVPLQSHDTVPWTCQYCVKESWNSGRRISYGWSLGNTPPPYPAQRTPGTTD